LPRYHFHVRDRGGRQDDADGMELPDIKAARAEAVKRACRTWSQSPPTPESNDDAYEITDENGQVALTVPFSEAFAERAVT
jgi:hypothetical protein